MPNLNKRMTEIEENNDRAVPESDKLALALPRLTPEQVAQISPKLKRESYSPGQFIIRQGQPATCFFIIVRGQAEVWHKDQKGKKIKLNSLGPGDYCGETGLIQNMPRNASVQVSPDSPLEVFILDQEGFKTMMQGSKATEMHMAQEMVQRLIKLANAQASD